MNKLALLLVRLARWCDPSAVFTHEPTSRGVVEKMMNRPIEWVIWRELPPDKRRAWGDAARDALLNPALQSIIGKTDKLSDTLRTNGELVKNLIEHAAKGARDWDEVRDTRSKITGVELVREYLEDMLYNSDVQQEHVDNPYDSV